MEVIEILDEEVYNANKDTQNIQILLINHSDSSSDNETKMAYFTKNLGVSTVIYSTVPIEYPATSSDGVATVFSIQGWKDHMDAFNDYSIGGGGGSPIQKSVLFLVIFLLQNIIFLAAQDSHCKFKQNGITCSGQPKLIRLLEKESYKYRWIIEAIMKTNIDQCSTSKSSRTKKCAYIYYCNGSVTQGKIVDKPCNVKMISFIPNDLQECPFVALICVRIHNHPPPPPERTPNNIKDNLQSMIKEAIENDDAVTSGSIIQGNMLKAYFNKETLQEIHIHVKGDINEFEINSYDDYHNLILSYCCIYTNVNTAEGYYRLFDVIKQLTGKPIQVKHIHVHFQRNLYNKHFSDPIKKKMISLLKATSKAELDQIFSDIEKFDEYGVNDWIDYY
ncbi:unnamed protein product [Rhizophagus irregularis]|nr:unnamed protein product [Rhizophagus irregularis]CAB4429296.1 unnamed protein product [Rhizophagus irregularis]